jgi:tetratricopeptide (TPR) repeat protein
VLVAQALPVFHEAEDHHALYVAYSALAELESQRAKMDASLDAAERASFHARQASHPAPGSFGTVAAARFFGTTPVPELMAWLDEHEHERGRDHFFRAYRAWSLAKLGRFDEARAILAEARRELVDRGSTVLLANITAFESVGVELLAGDPAAAVEFGAEGFRLHEELGDQTFMAAAAPGLANALYALDRLDEADAWARRSQELGAGDDAWNQMLWRQVRAKVLARRGERAEAERLAREAVAIADETEMLDAQGDAYADLGEVLALGGRPEDTVEALQQASARYERKGNVVMADRTRHRLSALRDAAAT